MPETRRAAQAQRATDGDEAAPPRAAQPQPAPQPAPQSAPPEAAPAPPVPVATARYQQRRQAILEAAARRFNACGLRGATLADIARDVGLVTTSLTYYYRRKEDLAVACFEQAIATHRALAEQAFAQAGSTAGRVAALAQAQVTLLAAQADGRMPALIEFSDIRALPPAQADGVFEAYNGLFRAVRALLHDLVGQGLDRAGLNARAHLLLSAINLLRLRLPRVEPDLQARVASRAASLLLHGLGAAPQTWPGHGRFTARLVRDAGRGAPMLPGDVAVSEAFLRAATELVNEQGYRGASIDRITARLQMTKGAFYHHHDHKLDLISACFDRSQRIVRQALQAVEQWPGTGWQRSCVLTSALVQLQLSAPGPLLRATAYSAMPDAGARDQVRRQARLLHQRLVGVLVDGMEDGSIRPLDPALAAQLLAGATNAAAELERWVPDITQAGADAAYARPALCGLLSPP